MREGRDRYLIAAKAAGILDDTEHPLYHTMGKFFHEAVDGRPNTPVEISVNEDLADALKLARARAAGR